MKELLFDQFQQIINNSNEEDLVVLSKWMNGFEKKQSGEISTYINAGLHMEKTLTDDFCKVSIPVTSFIHNNLRTLHGGIIAIFIRYSYGCLSIPYTP